MGRDTAGPANAGEHYGASESGLRVVGAVAADMEALRTSTAFTCGETPSQESAAMARSGTAARAALAGR